MMLPAMPSTDLANYVPGTRGPGSVHSSSGSTAVGVPSSIHEFMNSPTLGNICPPNFPSGSGGATVDGPTLSAGIAPYKYIPHSHSGPAVYMGHGRRLSNATTTSSMSGYPSSRHSGGGGSSTRPASTGARRHPRVSTISETGSPKERKRNSKSTRVLMRPDLEAEYLAWAEDFQSLFALVHGFCASYFHELPRLDTDWKTHLKAEANGDLWQYMCRICHTAEDHEPGDHALRLLKDRDSRPHLMQRLILQHILVFIFSFEGWKEYSEDVDAEMERLAEALRTGDGECFSPCPFCLLPLANTFSTASRTQDRQAIVDRRSELVKEMADGPNSEAFKNFKLTQHHRHLKTMVAPFLARRKTSNVDNEAFYDLFTITTTAWDLSAKLFAARLTCQYVWNDVGARFSADTHEPLDCTVSRLTLQYERCHVMLCATPAVTMRNDKGMTIETKNILKSGVLVLRYGTNPVPGFD